jgi:hypothetical protein
MKFFTTVVVVLYAAVSGFAQCVQPLVPCDSTATDTIEFECPNNQFFWNNVLWGGPDNPDLYEKNVDLNFRFIDTCGLGSITFNLLLDLDGDGIRETLLNPDNILADGQIRFDNFLSGGMDTVLQFHSDPSDPTGLQTFLLHTESIGDTVIATIFSPPSDLLSVQYPAKLPKGRHLLQWILSDGNSVDTCSREIWVQDFLPPEIECSAPLTTPLPPNRYVAFAFNQLTEFLKDYGTPLNLLETSMRIAGTGSGFPLDGQGHPIDSLRFNCSNLGSYTIELWSQDLDGNAGYCTMQLTVNDDFQFCVDPDTSVCVIEPCFFSQVPDIPIFVEDEDSLSLPLFLGSTQQDGCITLPSNLPPNQDYSIFPYKDENYLQGVSTYDLVLISKHILGLEPFDLPQKYIAADVNNSYSVTTFDIVETRKLLLGIYTEFPHVTSWRFVRSDHAFSDPNNPLSDPFPESVLLSDVQDGIHIAEFYAVKMGDVNCSAFSNNLNNNNNRQKYSLYIPNIQMKPNEWYEIPVYADGDLVALQAELTFASELTAYIEIHPGSYPGMSEDVFAQKESEGLRMSWFHHEPVRFSEKAPLFTLLVQSQTAGDLSHFIRLNPTSLQAEAYDGLGEKSDLQLLFRKGVQNGMECFAPYPNPGLGAAFFPVKTHAPKACTISLYDARGQLIFSQKSTLTPGLNQLEIPAEAFSAGGVYLWKIECSESNFSGNLIR